MNANKKRKKRKGFTREKQSTLDFKTVCWNLISSVYHSLPRHLRILHEGGRLHASLASNFYFSNYQFDFHIATTVVFQSPPSGQSTDLFSRSPASCCTQRHLPHSTHFPGLQPTTRLPQRCLYLRRCSHIRMANSFKASQKLQLSPSLPPGSLPYLTPASSPRALIALYLK